MKSQMIILFLLLGCDPEGKKNCDWQLDLDSRSKQHKQVKPGYIPVCARNYKTGKQDCRLQISLEFAKKHHDHKFRYSDMEVDGPGIPRTIKHISPCK